MEPSRDGVDRSRSSGRGVVWLWVSVFLAIVVGVLLLVLPLSTAVGASTDFSGGTQVYETRHSLLDEEGWGMAAILLIPVALCAAPLPAPGRTRAPFTVGAAILLGMGVVVGSASIGWFYLPVVATMAIAASRMWPEQRPG